ncbi:nucleotide disphospho-sugar-binding domain-containing protein [Streptomyces sp. enrichment culture]|uniref:nucleotide disphospho-sugar-binding domain-containing protein n=1 Tax=Streptomyces sp. enrichment culture TaxID=1795815 RepID=UPI003F54F5B0
MRVLFAARRSLPHLTPMAPTALACAAAGHEVRIAAPVRPDGYVLGPVLSVRPPEAGWRPHLVVRAEDGDGPAPWPQDGRVVHWTALDHRDQVPRHGGDAGPWYVDPCPPVLRTDAEAGAWAVRYEEPAAARPAPRWLRTPPGRLRVCLRPGAGHHVWPAARVRRVARAVHGLDAELVVVVDPRTRYRYRDAFEGPVRFAAPHLIGTVLATSAGVVHEGGPDVTPAAAAVGVPQLVLADDRPAGDRLHRIGGGQRLAAADADDAADLADALRLRRRLAELLHGGRALAAAQRLRSEIAALSPPDALVGPLEEYAAGSRRTDPVRPTRPPEDRPGPHRGRPAANRRQEQEGERAT